MACISINCSPYGCDDCSVNAPTCGGNTTNLGTAVSGTTIVDADDINLLRNAIDDERTRRGQGGYSWASTITGGSTVIQASHYNEANTAINSLDQFENQPCTSECGAHSGSPDYCSGVATGSYSVSDVILAADINELRGWINDVEGACVCNTDCGTDNYCNCDDNCGCNYS